MGDFRRLKECRLLAFSSKTKMIQNMKYTAYFRKKMEPFLCQEIPNPKTFEFFITARPPCAICMFENDIIIRMGNVKTRRVFVLYSPQYIIF